MKKLLCTLLVLPFVLASCSSDDDKDDDKGNNSLVATVWSVKVNEDPQPQYITSHTFYFALGGKCNYERQTGNFDPFKAEHEYAFNEKENTLVLKTNKTVVGEGRVDGNTMTMTYREKTLVLTKIR